MKQLKIVIITVLILGILTAGGFFGLRYYSDLKLMEDAAAGSFDCSALEKSMASAVTVSERKGLPDTFKLKCKEASEAIKAIEAEKERIRLEEEARRLEEERLAALAAANIDTRYEDKNPPVFLYYRGTPQIKVGGSFDIHKYIGYGDDVDRDVDLKVEGSVNTGVEGVYSLKITLTDDAGRTTTKKMDVSVVSDTSSGSSGESKKEDFGDFVANFKTPDTYVGIDVSRWQEDIDFTRVKAAGCEFAYMRLGGYDNGEHFVDRCFEANRKGARDNGLMMGIYWYGEEGSAAEVKASVKYLMDVLGGEALDFPIAYDWEDYRNFETHGMNLHDLNDRFADFEREVEKYGYKACLYGSKNALINTWTHERKNPVWLAQYNVEPTYEGSYFMWQHSSVGRIDGINGDVDLDVFYPAKMVLK